MFYHITGALEVKGENFAVIDANGVGYKIYTSFGSLGSLPGIGEAVKMYTYLYVREDILDLYGFYDIEELKMFEMLISVSGVGPKAALSLLSSLSPNSLALAIVNRDTKALTAAQGIGPKAAQRIVLELSDKIAKSNLPLQDQGGAFINTPADSEALGALTALGYSRQEARSALSGVDLSQDLELIIKDALKRLIR